jgi:hypothetical protein
MNQIYPDNNGMGPLNRIDPVKNRILSIHFADANDIRTRKVVRRSNAKRTGKYPGLKAGRMMQWESKHECNAMRLLDACPAVIDFKEQPCEISYVMDGVKHRHYPDLLVTGNGWKELWEVKVQRNAQEPEVAKRTRLLTRFLSEHGYAYRMMLAEDLSAVTRLDNAKLLLRIGRIKVTPLEREQIRQIFMTHQFLTWGALGANHRNPKLLRQIARLILEGVLTFNFDLPLTATTQICWVLDQTKKGGASWESLISSKA